MNAEIILKSHNYGKSSVKPLNLYTKYVLSKFLFSEIIDLELSKLFDNFKTKR